MEKQYFYKNNKHIYDLDANKDKISLTYFAIIIQEVKKFNYVINNKKIIEYRSSFFFPDFPMLAGCVDSIDRTEITSACCILLQNHITKLHEDKELLPNPMSFDEIKHKYVSNGEWIWNYHITVVKNKDGKDELMVIPNFFDAPSWRKIFDNFFEKLQTKFNNLTNKN